MENCCLAYPSYAKMKWYCATRTNILAMRIVPILALYHAIK